MTDHGMAFLAAGIAFGGAAIGAAIGNGLIGNAAIAGVARQPESRARVQTLLILTISFVETAFFVTVALGFYLAVSR